MSDVNLLLDPNTGNKYPVGGCIISDKPSDAPTFGSMRTVSSQNLPPGVDLRQLMTPIEDQLNNNACVGNALAGAYEFLIKKNSRKHIDISRLFIYFNSRLIDGQSEYSMRDIGTQITSAIKGLASYGCCKEALFLYDSSNFNRRPSQQCYTEAKSYRIASSMSIATKLDEMKACLAEGYPFVFGLQLFQSFGYAGSNQGRVQAPNFNEQQAAQHGWHAMLAVGYSEPSRCFIVRNSWGPNWGDNGYCYIPYEYICNPNYCRDLHAVKAVEAPSRRDAERQIDNPYNWNTHKDTSDAVPQDYPFTDFHYEYFWQFNNQFNYFDYVFQDGQITPFVWYVAASSNDIDQQHNKPNSGKKLIVWIDEKHSENNHIANKLSSDNSIEIQFYGSMDETQNYLLKHKDFIRSLSNVAIICRGFYKKENKNSLNLLDFLMSKGFGNIHVFVFTQDRAGVEYHLTNQSSTHHISDWQKRLTICENSNELIANIKQKF